MCVSRKTMNNRRGISLLEVLVAIGVTSVGLLGVLALIPLGGAQTRQGQIAERAPVIGLSAFAEIRNRDMLNPANWLTSAGVSPTAGAFPVNFCLDPLGIAAGNSDAFPQNATVPMNRLTLNNGVGAIMAAPMARSIFNAHDDLRIAFAASGSTVLMDSPPDRSAPPRQIWNLTKDSNDGASRRQAQENMSWMATVHPNYASGYGVGSDTFTVSVIVFNRRILDSTLQNEFTTNELTAADYPGAGVSGGDVVLTFANANDAKEAKTPENSWLLMGGRKQVDTDTNGNPIYLNAFQWYRVLASDQTNATQRQVTLAGPDWDTTLQNVQATIIPGTIAVYQKNMQLESSTLWRN